MRFVEDISGISVRDEAQAAGGVQQQTWGTGEERRAALTRRAVGAKVAETARLRQDTLKLEYPSLAGEIDRLLTKGWSRDDLRRHYADCERRALMFYGPQEVDAFLGRTDQTKRDLWDAMSAQKDDAYVRIMRDEMSEGKVRSLLHTAKSAGIAPGLLLRNHKDAQIMEAAERLAGKRLGWLGMIRAATGNMLASLERSTSNVWQLEARETERGDADRAIEKVMRGFGQWDREGQERWDRMPEEERQQVIRTQRAQMATRQRGLAEDWAMTAQEDQTHYRPPESQIGAFLLSAIENGGFTVLSGIRSGAAWAVGGPVAGLAMTAFNTYDESRGEAGEVFVEGLRRGWEPERAYEAAMQTQRENMMLLTATNYAFDVLTFGLSGAGRGLTKLGGRAAKAGSALGRVGHFLEHGMSDWLSRQAGKIGGDKLAARLARGAILRVTPMVAGAIPEGIEEYGQERIKARALGDEQDDAALAEAFKMGMGHAVLHSLVGLGTRRVVGAGVRKVAALTPTGRALAELSRRIGEANEIGTRLARGELKETDIVGEDPVVFVPRERLSPAALAELDPSRTVELEGGGVVDETMDAPEEAVQETEGELAVRKSVWDAWAQEHPEEAEGLSDVLREGTQGVTAAERMAQLLEEARRDAKDPLNADSEAAERARQIVDGLSAELERATSLSQEVRENWARVYGHRLLAASERFGVSVDEIHRVYVKRGEDAMDAAVQDATSSSEIPNSSGTAADVTAAEPLTFKLTGAPVSDAYMAALTDLEAGRPISQEAYDAIPEIQDARSRTATGSTLELARREGIQQQVYDALMAYGSAVTETVDGREQTSYTGPVRNERRADIIIGLPASGKSSALVDPISSRHGSMLIDSDEAKKLIPEFDDGFGAGYVHEESKLVVGQVIDDTTNQGRNIVLPIVGSDYEKLKKQIDMLRQKGYTVHIHMADIDPNIAAGRNMRRFAETGRFVDLAVTSFKYGNKPREVFEKVKKEGISDGYSRVDTTIFPGQRVEWTEDLSDDRGDLRAGRGRVHPELGAEREAEGSGAAPFEVEAAAGDRGSAGAVGAGAGDDRAAADITSVETTGGSPQEGAAPRPRGAVMARVRTASGTEIDVRYRVVSAGTLIASHGENGGVNEAYPKELQPRQRGREASIQQIHQMAASLDPELLGENRLASDGAPIVGPDSVVESGNGRVMAIRRAYRTGKADGYRAWLTQNAERFGIDPADVEAIADPVLIRERMSDVDRVRFVQEANQSSVSRMSKTEQALADAQRISPEMLVDLAPDADIASAANRQFVQQFLEKVVGSTEMGTLMDARGELSQDGRERISNALFAYAYGDTEAMARLRETLGDDTKTVTNALLGISPRMADMEGKMRQGGLHAELSLREALMEAANELAKLKRDGKTVAEYLAQGMIFSEGNISPEARAILQFFEANKRSAKAIRAGLARYVDLVEAQGSPAQISVFGDGPMSREELVYEAFGHEVGKQYASAEEIAREQGYGKDEGLFQLAVAALKERAETYAQRLFHGTRHVLEGMKFKLEKVGRGEGTQWEGWGVYLAQVRDTSESYRTSGRENDPIALGKDKDGNVVITKKATYAGLWNFVLGDREMGAGRGSIDASFRYVAEALDAIVGGKGAAEQIWAELIEKIEGAMRDLEAKEQGGSMTASFQLDDAKELLEFVKTVDPSTIQSVEPDDGPGNLYSVEGPEDDVLLYHDAPLSAQPEVVKKAIDAAKEEFPAVARKLEALGDDATGAAFYEALANAMLYYKDASLWLKDRGVPGARYLDEGSRAQEWDAPGVTCNFVIWDVDLLKVLDVEGPAKAVFDSLKAGGLAQHEFNIVAAEPAPFNSVKAALAWAQENGIIGLMGADETNGKGEVKISASSIKEMTNLRQMAKSVSKEAHFAALTKIRDIIRESELVESHPDYLKDKEGTRAPENGTNPGVTIDVLYGALGFRGDTYRVKTTIKRYAQADTGTKAYAYEVSEIEVLPGYAQPETRSEATGNASIMGEILLQGVTNSNGDPILGDEATESYEQRGRGGSASQLSLFGGDQLSLFDDSGLIGDWAALPRTDAKAETGASREAEIKRLQGILDDWTDDTADTKHFKKTLAAMSEEARRRVVELDAKIGESMDKADRLWEEKGEGLPEAEIAERRAMVDEMYALIEAEQERIYDQLEALQSAATQERDEKLEAQLAEIYAKLDELEAGDEQTNADIAAQVEKLTAQAEALEDQLGRVGSESYEQGAREAFDRDDPETWADGPRRDEAFEILDELDGLGQSEASGYIDPDIWMEGERKDEAQDIEDQMRAIDAADLRDMDAWAEGPRRDEAVALRALLDYDGMLHRRMDDLPQWAREDERVRELRGELEAVNAESLEAEGEEQEALDEALGEWGEALDAEIRALLEERFEELADEEQEYLDDEHGRLLDRLKELRGEERAASEARAEELEERFEELADEEEGVGESYGQDAAQQEQIERGMAAMERVLTEHVDVMDAMHRDDVGDIAFLWGEPGRGKKGKGGFGLSHLIARRDAQYTDGDIDVDGRTVARKIVEVIARGSITDRYFEGTEQERVDITYDGYEAHLGLYRFGDRQTWLITGYKLKSEAPDVSRELSGSPRPTLTEGIPRPSGEGAGASEGSIPHQPRRPRRKRAKRERPAAGALRGQVEFLREERDPVSGAVTREAQAIVYLMKNADPSTFLHEMWHIALDDLMTFGRMEEANEETRQDWETVKRWLGVEDLDFSLFALSKEERKAWTAEQKARYKADMERWHEAQEKFADAGEAYFQTGEAPSEALKGAFERIRAWLLKVYAGVKGDIELSDEVREVFDRMLATQGEMTAALEARTTVGDIALEDRMLRERIRELEAEIWRTEARLAETAAEAFRAGQQQKAEELRARRKRLEAKRAERQKLRNEVKRLARQMEAAAKDERVIYRRQLEIRELLKGYDLNRRTKKTLEKRAAALRAQEMGADVAEFLEAEGMKPMRPTDLKYLGTTTLGEMTVEQVRELHRQVTELRETGRRELELKELVRRERIDAAREELMGPMLKDLMAMHGKDDAPRAIRGRHDMGKEPMYRGVKGKMRQFSDWAYANTISAIRFFDRLDGGKGTFDGAWSKLFVDSTNAAKDEELRHVFRRLKSIEDTMAKLKLKPADLRKTRDVPGVLGRDGKPWTVDELLNIYAGMKNERSREAIIYGNFKEAWASGADPESCAAKCVEALTDKEKALADAIMRDYEINFDRIDGALIDVYNKGMDKEESYTPMRRLEYMTSEGLMDPDSAEAMMNARMRAGGMGRVDRGFQQSRVRMSAKNQRPIELGLVSIWNSQVRAQEHAAAFSGLVRDMRQILMGRSEGQELTVQSLVNDVHGRAAWQMIKTYYGIVARDDMKIAHDVMESASRYLARNMATAYLCGNIATALKQLGSFPRFLPYCGPKFLLKSIGEFLAGPKAFLERCYEMDPQLRNRKGDPILAAMQTEGWGRGGRYGQVLDVGMRLIGMMDRAASTIGWKAVYDANIKKGKSPDDAVKAAQKAVLLTQPAAQAKDAPRIWHQSGLAKLAMIFTTDAAQRLGITIYDMGAALRRGDVPGFLWTLFGAAAAATVVQLISDGGPEDWLDPVDHLKYWAAAFARDTVTTLPLVGKEALTAWDLHMGDEYFRGGETQSAFVAPFAKLLGGARGIWDGKTEQGVLDLIEAGSLVAPFPVTFVRRAVRTVKGVADGDVQEMLKGMIGMRKRQKKMRRQAGLI